MTRPPARSRHGRLAALALALGASLGAATSAMAQDAMRLTQEAARAQAQGNPEQALQLLGEALGDQRLSNDRRGAILTDRGALLARLNQPKPAIEDLNRAAGLYPEYPAIYNNRGSILLTLALAREAIKDFDRAILLAPGYVAAYNNRASAKLMLGQHEGAIADFTRAVELTPSALAPLAGRGKAYLAAHRPLLAQRDFSHALQIDNRLAVAYRNRAQARLELDRAGEAIEDLSRAIAFTPQDAQVYLERGHAYIASDNVPAALKDYAKALELQPQLAPGLEARAFAHIRLEAWDEAEANIQRALEANPRSAKAGAARALFLLRTGQPDQARREIDRVARLSPQDLNVLIVRGQIEEAAGQRSEAAKAYQAALAVQSFNKEAAAGYERVSGPSDATHLVELRGLGVDSWRVYRRAGRYFAASDDHRRLLVPLDGATDTPPRLTQFEQPSQAHRDTAVLRYETPRPGQPAAAYAAILDLAQASLLGTLPDRLGQRQATWTFEDQRLVVVSADGLTDEFQLRGGRGPSAVAAAPGSRRASADGSRTYAQPTWLPFGAPPPQQRRARQQPKTLFDMLFGN